MVTFDHLLITFVRPYSLLILFFNGCEALFSLPLSMWHGVRCQPCQQSWEVGGGCQCHKALFVSPPHTHTLSSGKQCYSATQCLGGKSPCPANQIVLKDKANWQSDLQRCGTLSKKKHKYECSTVSWTVPFFVLAFDTGLSHFHAVLLTHSPPSTFVKV